MYDVIIGYTTAAPNEDFLNLVRNLFNGCLEYSKENASGNKFGFTAVKISVRDVSPFFDKAIHLNQGKTNRVFVFDSNKIDKIFHVVECLKSVYTKQFSILLLSPKCKNLNEIVLKYDGTDNSEKSILAFHGIFPHIAEKAGNSILISPNTFTRSRVVREKQYVKRIAGCFNSLGFIKLPLKSSDDFYNYSIDNKMQMLILTRKDFFNLPKLIRNKEFFFRFKKSGLCVFVRL